MNNFFRKNLLFCLGILFSLTAFSEVSDEKIKDDNVELARKISNPVANLTSVPIQYNYQENLGMKEDGKRSITKIQPIIPFSISDDWNLITRTIVPVIKTESMGPGVSDKTGFGDTSLSLFFSPKEPTKNGIIWAAGPVILLPTESHDLGKDKLGLGPTFAALKIKDLGNKKSLTMGFLTSQIWTVESHTDETETNQLFIQPFMSYVMPTATTLTLSSEMTFDWVKDEKEIPIIFQIGQMAKIKGQIINFQLGQQWYADKYTGGSNWATRFQITFLFPR